MGKSKANKSVSFSDLIKEGETSQNTAVPNEIYSNLTVKYLGKNSSKQ
jgi:hypothetical protein